ncbi:hypothetical protein EDC96DRAFT_540001 [Choanephora cucurbitarum]|nr:hypothetical protein EDC96DRAFT_540001 [Choanephora cucurbitarum]
MATSVLCIGFLCSRYAWVTCPRQRGMATSVLFLDYLYHPNYLVSGLAIYAWVTCPRQRDMATSVLCIGFLCSRYAWVTCPRQRGMATSVLFLDYLYHPNYLVSGLAIYAWVTCPCQRGMATSVLCIGFLCSSYKLANINVDDASVGPKSLKLLCYIEHNMNNTTNESSNSRKKKECHINLVSGGVRLLASMEVSYKRNKEGERRKHQVCSQYI